MGCESSHVYDYIRSACRISKPVSYVLRWNAFASYDYILLDGFAAVHRAEGIPGLYRGTLLALFGVTSGALQFMAYEQMKRWGTERKKRIYEKNGQDWSLDADRLVCEQALHSHSVIDIITVQHGIHSHVRYIKINCSNSNVSISSNSVKIASTYNLLHNLLPLTLICEE